MSRKQNKSNQLSWEDYHDMSGKGVHKEKKKAKRHKTKTNLKQFQSGIGTDHHEDDWDEIMDDMSSAEKINNKGF